MRVSQIFIFIWKKTKTFFPTIAPSKIFTLFPIIDFFKITLFPISQFDPQLHYSQ